LYIENQYFENWTYSIFPDFGHKAESFRYRRASATHKSEHLDVFAAVGVLANCSGGVHAQALSLIPPLLVGEDANKGEKLDILNFPRLRAQG